MGKNTNRVKGHQGERLYAKLFREELGYTFCKTSREASRLLDNAGIDLAFIPFNIQLKTGFHKALNPIKLLASMNKAIIELFPPEDNVHSNPCIVIHRNQIGPGNKRVANDDLVFLLEKDYLELKNKLENKLTVIHSFLKGQKRGWTYKNILETTNRTAHSIAVVTHENKSGIITVMSFEDFKKLINK